MSYAVVVVYVEAGGATYETCCRNLTEFAAEGVGERERDVRQAMTKAIVYLQDDVNIIISRDWKAERSGEE